MMKDLEEKEDESEEEDEDDSKDQREDEDEDDEDKDKDKNHEGKDQSEDEAEVDVRDNPVVSSSPLTSLGDTPPPLTKRPRPPRSSPTSPSAMPTKRGRTADPIPIVSVPTRQRVRGTTSKTTGPSLSKTKQKGEDGDLVPNTTGLKRLGE
jgi:hypothetical protein